MKNLLLVIATLALIGLLGYATYEYNQRPKAAPNTVATSEYNKVVETMELHDSVNAANQAESQKKIDTLVTQRNTLCTTYKTAKVVVPATLCQ